MPALEIRAWDAREPGAALALARGVLGSTPATPMTEAFWQWKHAANPFGPSYGLTAWDSAGQTPVALRILLRWRFAAQDGAAVAAMRAVDTATHPDYRRQGLFARLTQQAVDELRAAGTDLIFNTPNSSSLPGYLKLGWEVVARWPLYVCARRPLRMALRRLTALRVPSPDARTAYFGPSALTWAEFDHVYAGQWQAVVEGWERMRPGKGLRTLRHEGYWRWRYGAHPHVAYAVLPLVQDDRLLGFAVLRPNVRRGWQEAVVAEAVAAAPALGPSLLAYVRRQTRADYLIAHFAAGTDEHGWLRRAGFWRVPRQGITFTVRPLQPRAAAWTVAEAWDLTLGDLEIF
jgi:GNAT superfamily N-acetyltransferase